MFLKHVLMPFVGKKLVTAGLMLLVATTILPIPTSGGGFFQLEGCGTAVCDTG